jgi:hypothetical protein
MESIVNIENYPDYAKDYKFIVACEVNGKLWFYGAWNDDSKTYRIADSLGDNAIVLTNKQ